MFGGESLSSVDSSPSQRNPTYRQMVSMISFFVSKSQERGTIVKPFPPVPAPQPNQYIERLPSLLLCCCDNTRTKKATWGRLQTIRDRSQGRDSSRNWEAGTSGNAVTDLIQIRVSYLSFLYAYWEDHLLGGSLYHPWWACPSSIH